MRRQPAAFLFGTRPMLLLTLAPILSSCPSLEAPKSEGADDRGRGRNGVSVWAGGPRWEFHACQIMHARMLFPQ
jgi:hypothetical protein